MLLLQLWWIIGHLCPFATLLAERSLLCSVAWSLLACPLEDTVYMYSSLCPLSAFGVTSVGQGNFCVHLPTVNFISVLLNYTTYWSAMTELALNTYVLVLNIRSCLASLVQTGAWNIMCSQQSHQANMFLIYNKPGIVTSQTRSHYGARTYFPDLPALTRPKHPLLNHFSLQWGAVFHDEFLNDRHMTLPSCSTMSLLNYHTTTAVFFLLC